MRIISGNYGGHRLKSSTGANIRSATDKVKESIFNMIGSYLDGEIVSNLFAESGGLAIKAVSRGYNHTVCVDKDYQALKIIKENIEITKESEKFITIKLDVDRVIERLVAEKQQLDYLFLDPSHVKQKIIDQIHKMEELGLSFEAAVTVCETGKTVELPEAVAGFHQIGKQIYGITAVTIYREEGNQ